MLSNAPLYINSKNNKNILSYVDDVLYMHASNMLRTDTKMKIF